MNSCIAGLSESTRILTLYSHLVPVLITVFLCLFALIKTKASKLSIIFACFGFSVSLWLVSDLISWGVYPDYFLIYFFWSWLDFLNIVFFVFGAYFIAMLARSNVSLIEKILFVLLLVPAFVITISGYSVIGFDQASCTATNSDWLTNYKLLAEGLTILLMFYSYIVSWSESQKEKKIQLSIVLAALILFLSVFGGTEYIASVTGNYDINLYGLFSLPVFLIVMVFSITNLGLFNFRFLGTQILSYTLILMSGSQLLFIQDSTQLTLSVITLAISIIFGVLLLQNAQKEQEARLKIEELARSLDTANKQQVTLIHFITHQIKGFVTKSRNIFSMALEGDYGVLPDALRPMIEEGFKSDTKGVSTIQEILNAANIKSGKVTYAEVPYDLKELTEEIIKDLKPAADAKSLVLSLNATGDSFTTTGDRLQMQNALKNLIDNSIKYTPSGSVAITLTKEAGKLRFLIQDTGIGITAEDMAHLFTEGGHGKDSMKVNVESTGFGLYIVKNIIEAQHGKVWAESEGASKGSKFIVELPA